MADGIIRKRQQIAKANKMMFLWVAAASALISIAIVVSIFLLQQAIFKEKVLAKKSETVATLKHNNEVVEELRNNIRLVNVDADLKALQTETDGEPLQVILDALPSDVNTVALGSSLENVLLVEQGIEITALEVKPSVVASKKSTKSTKSTKSSKTSSSTKSKKVNSNSIAFTFTVETTSGDVDKLRDLLIKLERSIRAVKINSLTIEWSGKNAKMSVQAEAYYEPGVTAQLQEEVVKP